MKHSRRAVVRPKTTRAVTLATGSICALALALLPLQAAYAVKGTPLYGPYDCGSSRYINSYGTFGAGADNSIGQANRSQTETAQSFFSSGGYHSYNYYHSGYYTFTYTTTISKTGYSCVS